MLQERLWGKYSSPSNWTAWHAPKFGTFHASFVDSHSCLRSKYFSYRKMFNQGKSRFMTGHIIRGYIIDEFMAQFMDNAQAQIDMTFPWGGRLIGRADGTIGVCVMEVKSVQHLPSKPERKHIEQVHCYMAGLNMKCAIISYINPVDMSMKEYDIPFDPVLWNKMEQWLWSLYVALDTHKLPPKKFRCRCRSCK